MPRSANRLFRVSIALFLLLSTVAPAFAENKPTDIEIELKPTLPDAATPKEDTGPQVGWLELKGELSEAPPAYSFLPGESADGSLKAVLNQLRHVAAGERHKGIVIYLDQPGLTFSQVHQISAAVADVRAKGKKVLFFAEAYDMRSYALACSGDMILLQNKGFIELTGVAVEEIYLAGLFEKIGVKADFVQTGKFKGAEEMFTRKGPSQEWSENFDNLLDDMYGQIIDRIAAARKMKPEAVEKIMENSLSMSDEDFVKAGLIDHVTSRSLKEVTAKAFGDDFDWDRAMGEEEAGDAGMDNPMAMFQMLLAPPAPKAKRDSIAVIHVHGPIMSGESSIGSFFGGQTVGSATTIRALNDARRSKLIKGVIVHIDSPGGSALASEVIWQAMRELSKEKPVYVSISSLAASGGYYIASGGDKIYATPGSIVGSIGVVSGKLAMGGLYEWAGIGVHRRSRGPLGDMFNSVEPFTLEQKRALAQMSDRIYQQFTDRVTSTRTKIKDIDAVAHGRLFTGAQGLKNGMVDVLGGTELALADLVKQTGLEEGKYDVINLPQPLSLPEYIGQMLGVSRSMPRLSAEQLGVLQVARTALGPRGYESLRQAMEGVMLLRSERVLTIMPHAVVVR